MARVLPDSPPILYFRVPSEMATHRINLVSQISQHTNSIQRVMSLELESKPRESYANVELRELLYLKKKKTEFFSLVFVTKTIPYVHYSFFFWAHRMNALISFLCRPVGNQ